MTWTNRLRLFGGILGVIAIVAVLTVIFNQRQTQAASYDGTISADTYVVGAAYGGTVSEQFVKDGDAVKVGDKLFTIQSVQLQQDLSNGLEVASSDAYTVDKKAGTLTYKATVAGLVSDLEAQLGNALSGGTPFAKITVADTEFVEANYLLSPGDYGRVQTGAEAKILLPNNQTITGKVTSIEVATDQGKARTKVRIDSSELRDPALGALTNSGTPVTATLRLRDDGPLAGVSDKAFDFVRQIGLS
ncbi:MAG TPA: HlyD family efflux transporter periplasmic adaptor subunit [Propionibacteriaceae bacterium]